MKSGTADKIFILLCDVAMMKAVLAEWCERNRIPLGSPESENQAKRIIHWFEAGCSTEALLRDIFLPPPPPGEQAGAKATRPTVLRQL